MSEPKKKRTPSKWIVLELARHEETDDKQPGTEQWQFVGEVVATSAKHAIETKAVNGEIGVTYVAISERNWHPHTAEVPPTPQVVLRPVKETSDGG